jgi:hypothetical protein
MTYWSACPSRSSDRSVAHPVDDRGRGGRNGCCQLGIPIETTKADLNQLFQVLVGER